MTSRPEMLCEFVDNFTRPLRTVSPSRAVSPRLSFSQSKPHDGHPQTQWIRIQVLHRLLVKSHGLFKIDDVRDCVSQLRQITYQDSDGPFVAAETNELEKGVVGQLTVALYATALDKHLAQASRVEAEAEWWADVERSTLTISLYLLQTLPMRIGDVVRKMVDALRARHLPISPSTLSHSSLLSIFSAPTLTLRPSLLISTLFPHLQNQQDLSLDVLLAPVDPTSPDILGPFGKVHKLIVDSFNLVTMLVNLPIELTRQECRYKRKSLEKIRDQRAEAIGGLAQLRSPLAELMHSGRPPIGIEIKYSQNEYFSLLDVLRRVISSDTSTSIASSTPSSPLDCLDDISQCLLVLDANHIKRLEKHRLLRPTRLTRLWPSLLVLPPLSLYIYTNYTSWVPAIIQMATDAKDTLRGFVEGWLIEPLAGVLRTVRTGGAGDVLVHEAGVIADVESLERMTVSLARDRLNFTSEQLQSLAEKVRLGDLTPVMQAYEEDIRTPLRSAVAGNLLRSLFIQVQKAKVDIDQALSGIDKLLKSQELTFAFVGVAPALAIVYGVGGVIARIGSSSVGRGKWGGRKRRRGVWEGLRRVERLLVKQPPVSSDSSAPLAPLPTGLLILSMMRLRSYALNYLPSRIREPFLEDLGDLEDPELDTDAKLRIVERMWRSWGTTGEGVIRP